MKVLIISKYAKKGGAAIAAYRLFEALKKQPVDVAMLVQEGGHQNEGIYQTGGTVLWEKINLLRFILERLIFILFERSSSVRFLFSLANMGERITEHRLVKEADIIHLHWINGGLISLRTLRRLFNSEKKVIWTFHDMWAFTGGCHYALECEAYIQQCGKCPFLRLPHTRDLSRRIWNRKKKAFAGQPFQVVTSSKWLGDCARSSSLLKNHSITNIPIPIDQSVYKPVDRMDACNSLGLDPGKKYILFGAATMKNMLKGFDYFVEAINLMYKDLENEQSIEIILFGKSRGDVAKDFPFKTHPISFTGSVKKIAELYNVAHMFVIPSLQDNLPNTIIESLSCGTPVVAFASGGIPEMIDHKRTGYIAERKSSRDLADGMKWTLTTEDYTQISRESRLAAEEKYSQQFSARMHMALYEKILSQ